VLDGSPQSVHDPTIVEGLSRVANDPLFMTAPWQDPSALLDGGHAFDVGTVLAGKYRLERPAGFGGMGAVWVARNLATNAEVAVKILVTSRAGVDDEQVARFRREAHAAAQLYHRGIVRVFDLLEIPGDGDRGDAPAAYVMVMELLRGETLSALIDRQRRFTLEETTAIVLPLLSALAHAHAQGIVHRDVKPENVFLSTDPDGHVTPKILDFGISKLDQPAAPKITTDGATLGTPAYMSPEQARGLPDVDARSDVFAAGILMYEMLSGKNPFASGTYHSVVAAVLERDPPPLEGVPPEVWQVVRRALEKAPAMRHADASELAAALRGATQRAGVMTPDASGGYPPARGSLGDRSVPPAPYREREPTTPSIRARARRDTRARAVGVTAAAAVGVLLAVGLYSRVGRAPAAGGAPASAPGPALAIDPAPTATAAATSAPAAAVSAVAAPSAPSAAPPRAVATTPAPAPQPRAVAHAPKSAPGGTPSGTAAPASSKPQVVRDPGF
jgi:serine/threonine-protein kinase